VSFEQASDRQITSTEQPKDGEQFTMSGGAAKRHASHGFREGGHGEARRCQASPDVVINRSRVVGSLGALEDQIRKLPGALQQALDI